MKRRGFLFGLFAAPLVPAVAKAAPSPAAAAMRRSRSYSEAQLLGWFKDCPEVMALDEPPLSWRTDWLDLADKYGVPLLGEPSSGPRGGCYDPEFVEYADRDGRPILRIPRATFESRLSDSCEADGEVEPPPGSGPPRRGHDR